MPEDFAPRYEIIDGRLFISPTPLFRHQEVLTSVMFLLVGLAREHDLDWIEVWRPDAAESEMPRESVSWRVGERTFEISLADIFRR